MDIFRVHDRILAEYERYVSSFLVILDKRVQEYVKARLFEEDSLWPEALIQLNPAYVQGATVETLIREELLHPDCASIFRGRDGQPIRFHQHQEDAIRVSANRDPYVVTSGTGSGKSLAFFVPIVNSILRSPQKRGLRAIIVYPMNALVNSQYKNFQEFTKGSQIRLHRYTGQESREEKERIRHNPPHVILTNYMMLEYMLTRPEEYRAFVERSADALEWLVLDEIHTYRGRQGSDVALLLRRLSSRIPGAGLRYVGTSATMATGTSAHERKEAVSQFVSDLFGKHVPIENVVEETLKRVIPDFDYGPADLMRSVAGDSIPEKAEDFFRFPLAHWIESKFGLVNRNGEYVRATPTSLNKGAQLLASETGLNQETVVRRLKDVFLAGNRIPEISRDKVFEFRVHQFFAQGGALHSTLEHPDTRRFTLEGQLFAPWAKEEKLLFPLLFCRSCGQDYYSCFLETEKNRFMPVRLDEFPDREEEEEKARGYLFLDPDNRIHSAEIELPDHWYETGREKIKKTYRDLQPQSIRVHPNGLVAKGSDGISCIFLPGRFLLCLHCGEAFDNRTSEFRKLASLSTEGRSTATTMLTLSALIALKDSKADDGSLKVLSFSDNRQDASLQAGHFNDFIQVSILRAALFQALRTNKKLHAHDIAQRVSEVLLHDAGKIDEYAREDFSRPIDVHSQMAMSVRQTLRDVVAYKLFNDLERGWRFIQPNLEQCGLLRIEYAGLDELAKKLSAAGAPPFEGLSQQDITDVLQPILDEMRKFLAIQTELLEERSFDELKRKSSSYLCQGWGIERIDKWPGHRKFVFAGVERRQDMKSLGKTSGIGKWLRKKLPVACEEMGYDAVVEGVIAALMSAQIVTSHQAGNLRFFRLLPGAIVWSLYDGPPPRDVIRSYDTSGGTYTKVERTGNAYFREFYQRHFEFLTHLHGAEHTAAISVKDRIDRENRFKDGRINGLFCSPTMELGVDISDLNIVHMRNVPPGPANYAQRSGRSGRAGQSALVMTYCTAGGGHDQYYFKHREEMVAGSVRPPRLELLNDELVKTHIHAVWMQHTGVSLGSSVQGLLNLDAKDLALKEETKDQIKLTAAEMESTVQSCLAALTYPAPLGMRYDAEFVGRILREAAANFDSAFNRWRDLYRTAQAQLRAAQERNLQLHRFTGKEYIREEARNRRLIQEAQKQLQLLLAVEGGEDTDFYPYRYLASEGFLPGYNFPAIPVRVYLPRGDDGEFVSRAKTLALQEFGPRNIIYHDGRKYYVNRARLPARADERFTRVRICKSCDYIYEDQSTDKSVCDNCHKNLSGAGSELIHGLLDMPEGSTKIRERISSEEEIRRREGYLIDTHYQFRYLGGQADVHRTSTVKDSERLFDLAFAPAAIMWRLNHKWRRNKEAGFRLDLVNGYWMSNQKESDEEEGNEETSAIVRLFVKESTNILLIKAPGESENAFLVSLQHALLRGIQAIFQIEEDEIGSEILGEREETRILLFENATGSLGILRRLVSGENLLRDVAAKALDILHFSPEGLDVNADNCKRACYDCLLSYYNQTSHRLLDRHSVKDFLVNLAQSFTESVQIEPSYNEKYNLLKRSLQGKPEALRVFLDVLHQENLALPDRAWHKVSEQTAPVHFYFDQGICVFIQSDENRHQVESASAGIFESGRRVIRIDEPPEGADGAEAFIAQLARFKDVFYPV